VGSGSRSDSDGGGSPRDMGDAFVLKKGAHGHVRRRVAPRTGPFQDPARPLG